MEIQFGRILFPSATQFQSPGAHFAKGTWALNLNIQKIIINEIMILMILTDDPVRSQFFIPCHDICSCCACSTVPTFLVWFLPYLPKWSLSWEGCVMKNYFWPWPISLSSVSCDCNKTAKIYPILLHLLCDICSSGWIIFIFGTNDH